MKFSQFMEKKYIEWMAKQGGRRTVSDFTKFLDLPQSTVSTWWSRDTKPKEEQIIRKLALKLGIEVYDVLDLPRPDPDFLYLQEHWDELPDATKKRIREQAEKYTTKND